jgi:hypothetical protein
MNLGIRVAEATIQKDIRRAGAHPTGPELVNLPQESRRDPLDL